MLTSLAVQLRNNPLDHVRVGFGLEKNIFSLKKTFLLQGKANKQEKNIFNQVFFLLFNKPGAGREKIAFLNTQKRK